MIVSTAASLKRPLTQSAALDPNIGRYLGVGSVAYGSGTYINGGVLLGPTAYEILRKRAAGKTADYGNLFSVTNLKPQEPGDWDTRSSTAPADGSPWVSGSVPDLTRNSGDWLLSGYDLSGFSVTGVMAVAVTPWTVLIAAHVASQTAHAFLGNDGQWYVAAEASRVTISGDLMLKYLKAPLPSAVVPVKVAPASWYANYKAQKWTAPVVIVQGATAPDGSTVVQRASLGAFGTGTSNSYFYAASSTSSNSGQPAIGMFQPPLYREMVGGFSSSAACLLNPLKGELALVGQYYSGYNNAGGPPSSGFRSAINAELAAHPEKTGGVTLTVGVSDFSGYSTPLP